MLRPMPPLNWLRTFEACARHMCLTAAANEPGPTQSAVSQQKNPKTLGFTDHLLHKYRRSAFRRDVGQCAAYPRSGTITWLMKRKPFSH
jgi:LysR family glycine cleavage system transcriptional activator